MLGYCIVGEKEGEEQRKEKDSVSCVDFTSVFEENRNKKREAFFNCRGGIKIYVHQRRFYVVATLNTIWRQLS